MDKDKKQEQEDQGIEFEQPKMTPEEREAFEKAMEDALKSGGLI